MITSTTAGEGQEAGNTGSLEDGGGGVSGRDLGRVTSSATEGGGE